MSQEQVNRKLTCIFSTDVVGYSRLMEENEASTVRYLEENKKLISKLIEEYNGRVVDSPGDNLLAEFSSAVKAVDCAVKIQKELKIKNAELVENRRMQFRIGINLGDVIEEDGRIYGSGVNIAARLEGLADPGGICISRKVYDEIRTKLDLGYEYLGEHEVKNITELVQVYKVLIGAEHAGKVIGEKKRGGIHSKLAIAAILIIIAVGWLIYSHQTKNRVPQSIAVLPFENLSSDPEQEYFVDGLSEEILNSLTHIPNLTVIAKTSSFSFKGQNKTVQEIAKILGVGHILEGSVRKSGNTIRITAQLIKADDESHLWSETYDKDLGVKEIFAVQEDIANNVADKLKLTLEAFNLVGGTENVEAYELYLISKGQIRDHYGQTIALEDALENFASNVKSADELIDKAVNLDPKFALAWAYKGIRHLNRAFFVSGDQVSLEQDMALEAAQKAIGLEPNLGQAYFTLGLLYSTRNEFIKAENYYRKGMEFKIESTDYWEYRVNMHYGKVGHLRKCQEIFEDVLQKDPLRPDIIANYINVLGVLGDLERAEKLYERGKTLSGEYWFSGDLSIFMARIYAKDDFSIKDVPESLKRIFQIRSDVFNESPGEGLEKIRQLYNSDNNENSAFMLIGIGPLAARLGDAELALDIYERTGVLPWGKVNHEVRQLPRFKEFVREIGLVEYWKEYGWPDLCHPLGDDDFECD
jgi:adenylate cyclase